MQALEELISEQVFHFIRLTMPSGQIIQKILNIMNILEKFGNPFHFSDNTNALSTT
jgi:hypothetical protein